MADEPSQAPDEVQDKPPEAEAPEADKPEASPVDYEAQYNELRPQFTQATQRLSEYEQFIEALQDPETQAEALKRLGLEIQGDDEDEDEYADPYEALNEKIAALEGRLQQEDEQYQEQAFIEAEHEYIDKQIDALEKELGLTFDDEEANVIGRLAQNMRLEDNAPDVKGAYESIYKTLLEKQRTRWINSKRAPHVSKVGQGATEQPDLDNRQDRVQWMTERLQQSQQQ